MNYRNCQVNYKMGTCLGRMGVVNGPIMATLRSPGLKVKLLVGYMENPTQLKAAFRE